MRRIGEFIQIYFSLILLFGAVVTDLRTGRIPNWWIGIGLGAGTALMLWHGSEMEAGSFLLGLAIPMLVGWIPFRMRAIGAGDVKLFLVLGGLNGGEDVFYCIFLSFLIAAGFSLGRLLRLRQLYVSLDNCFHFLFQMVTEKKIRMYPGRRVKSHTIHFAVAIFLGYIVWLGVKACKIVLLL